MNGHDSTTASVRVWVLLGLIVAAFLLIRGPLVWRTSGGQDEEWYGIPGLMVAQDGVPRVPYSRATKEGSVFLGAERMLFAMPPLSFYAQAPFFLVLPPTYGTARLSSLVAGCVAIVFVFLLGRHLLGDDRIGLWAAGIYSLSRLLFFPATFARPDMLCGMFGLLAVLGVWQWRARRCERWLMLAGVCLGLAGLCHPFAIVFALQLFPWVLIVGRRLKGRVMGIAVLGVTMAATFSLWTPLILVEPTLFRSQFLNNIVAPAGPGLFSRLLMPWDSFAHHLPQLVDRAHPIQFGMLLGGWVVFGWLVWSGRLLPRSEDDLEGDRRPNGSLTCWLLAGSSVYLLIACQGEHPIQGYWCYSAGLLCLCLAACIVWAIDRLSTSSSGITHLAVAVVIVFAMLPGSGVRTVFAHLRHPTAINYQNAAFVRSILADIPEDATISVGIEFALDTYGDRTTHGHSGDTILGIRNSLYFDSTQVPTDYVILGRLGLAEKLDEAFGGELIGTYGDPDDEFSCYAELYRVR